MTSDFKKNVIDFVKKIPRGRVASYGQVASACGHPKAARQVGGILRGLNIADEKIPWWRVINNRGIITIKGNWTATKELQRGLLVKDGIKVSQDFVLDFYKYRFSISVKGDP
ncbi:MAG: MGMT family protein [Candidatus Doudnabacteria bacterium]|nr:MGMT family protein [Candidatus Doudnabacteria bacterium]